jgi:hypothetical protein
MSHIFWVIWAAVLIVLSGLHFTHFTSHLGQTPPQAVSGADVVSSR